MKISISTKSLFVLLLFPTIGASTGQDMERPRHPLSLTLESLLGRVKNTRNPRRISSSTADSLVELMNWIEKVGRDTIDGYSSGYAALSNVDLIYPAFDKIIAGAKKQDRLLKAIIRLDLIIHRNVELAESMPECVQQVARNNTAGFLRVFHYLSKKERDRILTELSWPSEINVRAIFKKFAGNTKSSKLKAEAQYIVGAVSQEGFEEDKP